MTVRDLIANLQRYNPDALAVIELGDHRWPLNSVFANHWGPAAAVVLTDRGLDQVAVGEMEDATGS